MWSLIILAKINRHVYKYAIMVYIVVTTDLLWKIRCDLWDRPVSRAPPIPDQPEQLDLELQYVDTDEFLMAL